MWTSFFVKVSTAFEHGGVWMWPIFIVQMFSWAIILERLWVLVVQKRVKQKQLAFDLLQSIRENNIDQAIEKAKGYSEKHMIASVFIAGAQAALSFGGRDQIQAKMDEVLLQENARLDRRVAFLSMLANVATLTGLLGTISGMIEAFTSVAQSDPTQKAALLTSGISAAMNCTAYGLVTAIPALLMYSILQNRVHVLLDDLHQAAFQICNELSYFFQTLKV